MGSVLAVDRYEVIALLGQPVKTGREALVWPAYLEQLGYAPLCEVCGLPLIAVSAEEEVARVA